MAPDKALFLSMFYSTNPDLSSSIKLEYIPIYSTSTIGKNN